MKQSVAFDVLKKKKKRKKKYWYVTAEGQRRYTSSLKELPYKVRKARMIQRKNAAMSEAEKAARRAARHAATLERQRKAREAQKRLTELRRQRRREEKERAHRELIARNKRLREIARQRRLAEKEANRSARGKALKRYWESEAGKKRKQALRDFYKTAEGKAKLAERRRNMEEKKFREFAKANEFEKWTVPADAEPFDYGEGRSYPTSVTDMVKEAIIDIPDVVYYSYSQYFEAGLYRDEWLLYIAERELEDAYAFEVHLRKHIDEFQRAIEVLLRYITYKSETEDGTDYGTEVATAITTISNILHGYTDINKNIKSTDFARAFEQLAGYVGESEDE